MIERVYELADFDAIRLSGSHDVFVKTGATVSVRAEGAEKALDALDVAVSDGTLSIGSRRSGIFGVRRGGAVAVHVTVPGLRRASIAGSGEIRVDKVQGSSFEAAIAGSGDIRIDDMDVEDARFSIAGSGDVKACGRAQTAGMKIAGSGDGDLSQLLVEDAEIAIRGSGDVHAHATGSARVSIRGAGDVKLAGGATCTIDQAGSGRVQIA